VDHGFISQCKEDLSEAYIRSVAAAAGCWVDQLDRDYDGIDVMITRYGDVGTFPDASLRVQLKASHGAIYGDHEIRYDLSVTNYDKLRVRRSSAPAILVLLVVPEDPTQWLEQDEVDLHLLRAAYWRDLLGAPETDNRKTIRISIPRGQLLTVTALEDIMARVTEDNFP
jgi:hypothetical protein